MVEPVKDTEQNHKVQNGADDAVQINIHDVLEKLAFSDVIAVLKQHWRQQYQEYQISQGLSVLVIGKYDHVECDEDSQEYS